MTRSGFVLLAFLFSAEAVAGPLRFAAGYWDYDVRGYEVDNGVRRDLQRDLHVQPNDHLQLMAEYDWRQSWFPDLAVSYSRFGGDGLTRTQTGGGLLGGGSTAVTTTHAELRDLNLTLRWPVTWGAVTLSPGLSLQKLDGEIVVDDAAHNTLSRQTVDEVFPQVHVEARWQPSSRVTLRGVLQAISSGAQSASEYRVLAGWQILGPLTLQAGWQQKRYDLRQSDSEIHARLSGALLLAGLTF